MVRALFLDRDGVINEERNYLHKIEDFCFIDGIIEVLKYFQGKNYLLLVVTNQSGIGRGYYTEADFRLLNDWMLAQLSKQKVNIAKVYFSPYHPVHGLGKYKRDSNCRKPKPGMILQAQEDFDLDLSQSFLLGDKESDIETGIRAGVGTNVLLCAQQGSWQKTDAIAKVQTKANYIVHNCAEFLQLPIVQNL